MVRSATVRPGAASRRRGGGSGRPLSPSNGAGNRDSFLCSYAAVRAVLGAFLVALVFFKVVVLDGILLDPASRAGGGAPDGGRGSVHSALRRQLPPGEPETGPDLDMSRMGNTEWQQQLVRQQQILQQQQMLQQQQRPPVLQPAPVRLDADVLEDANPWEEEPPVVAVPQHPKLPPASHASPQSPRGVSDTPTTIVMDSGSKLLAATENKRSRPAAGQDQFSHADNGVHETHGTTALHQTLGHAADLEFHKANAVCWSHFDIGFLEEWDSKKLTMCSPIPGLGEEVGSSLYCRVTNDDHLPAPTRPHTACDGWNIGIDFTKLTPVRCPKYRPNYKCAGPPVFYLYGPGALQSACNREPVFTTRQFPNDHLKDIFSSWKAVRSLEAMNEFAPSKAPVTLFLTRERAEHVNLFHATTDFINAFEALHLAGVIDITKEGDRSGIENVQVMILDEQNESPFDVMFEKVFSPNFPVMRVGAVKQSPDRRLLFRRAVFSPPGYTNFLFAHLFRTSDCRESLQLLQSFRLFVLAGLGIETPPPSASNTINIVVISRKPYTNFVVHKFVGRQVSNEPALMAGLSAIPNVQVQLVDLVYLSFLEQVQLMVSTDILIGMHGAALSHVIYLPPWAAVLELWPKTREMWRVFEHLAEMCGLVYERWANRDKAAYKEDKSGDYTAVKVDEVKGMTQRLITKVLERRGASKR